MTTYAYTLDAETAAEAARGYVACQLWIQNDDARDPEGHGVPLDENYTLDDVTPGYLDEIAAEILAVFGKYPATVNRFMSSEYTTRVGDDWDVLGHNYYLSREGHGTGFWDRGTGLVGDALAEISRRTGEARHLFDDAAGVLMPDRAAA